MKYQDDLGPRIYKLRTLVANAAIYALIGTDIANISTHRPTVTDKPLASKDVPIYREVILAGVPMRENYKQEWEKYRKEAAAYRQTH